VRCGVLSVVEYEVLLQGLVVLCSGLHSIVMLLHSIVMLLYSTSTVQCIYSQYYPLFPRKSGAKETESSRLPRGL